MHTAIINASVFFDELKKHKNISDDKKLAEFFGVSPSRISQMRNENRNLTAQQFVSFIEKAEKRALNDSIIHPIVEMYPINAVFSRQGANRELFPTDSDNPNNLEIRNSLEDTKGLYFFYDSQGCAIYAGKTEKQNLWTEMNKAFNRLRSDYKIFLVNHPKNFSPSDPKQLKKQIVYLYNTAHYFSAYKVTPALISKLEALVIRAFCNSLSNKKMEQF